MFPFKFNNKLIQSSKCFLLLLFFQHSVWLEDAFDRAKQLYLSYYRSIPKSLERSTACKLMHAMLNGDQRFVEPMPESLQNLTLQSVKDAVMNQFSSDNMEVDIVFLSFTFSHKDFFLVSDIYILLLLLI